MIVWTRAAACGVVRACRALRFPTLLNRSDRLRGSRCRSFCLFPKPDRRICMHDHLAGHDSKPPQLVHIAAAPYQKPHDHQTKFLVGLDVGSTTVKATVVDAATDQILWQDYQRHETKQPEKTLEFLRRMETEVGINRHNTRMFMTGSGGGGIAEQIGAKFVQEVT